MEILTELECIIRSEISNNVFINDNCLFVQFPNNTMAIISQNYNIQQNIIKVQKNVDKKTIKNYDTFKKYLNELIKTDYYNYIIENECITICGEKLYLKKL